MVQAIQVIKFECFRYPPYSSKERSDEKQAFHKTLRKKCSSHESRYLLLKIETIDIVDTFLYTFQLKMFSLKKQVIIQLKKFVMRLTICVLEKM